MYAGCFQKWTKDVDKMGSRIHFESQVCEFTHNESLTATANWDTELDMGILCQGELFPESPTLCRVSESVFLTLTLHSTVYLYCNI